MAFQAFPSVRTTEVDATNTVPSLSTTVAGYAGHFNWGPGGELIQLGSEKDLVSYFGAPTGESVGSFLTAASFLKFGAALQVSRAIPANAFNAVGGSSGVVSPLLIQNSDAFDAISPSTIGSSRYFFAKYPGVLGSSLAVKIAWGPDSYTGDIAAEFDFAPGSTEWADKFGTDILDEIHVLVIDEDGAITGVQGTILEKFQGLSLASGAKTSAGATNYYKDVINTGSAYILMNSLVGLILNADKTITSTEVQEDGFSLVSASTGTTHASTVLPSFKVTTTTVSVAGSPDVVTNTEVAAEFTVRSKFNFASKASGNNIQLSFITSPGLVNDTTASFDIHDLVNGFVNVTINLQTDNNGAPPQFSIATVADIAAAIAAAAPVTYDSVEYDLSDIIEIVYPTAADANATFRPSVPALQVNLSGGGVTAASGLITTSLHSGSNGTVSGDNVVDALQLFRDNVGNVLLFTENFRQEGAYVGTDQQTIDLEVAAICHARQNCVGFLSAPLDVATASSNAAKKALCLAKFNTIGSSSYLAFDETPLYVYNRYADSYSWIPACGQQAGLCAWTAFVGEAWQSPAGLNRGQLLGVTKIAYNPNEADQADLYKARINCILNIPGEGIVLFGDKTALTKPSAFDRLNVRFLFIILRTDIARFARYQLFELNDEFTRAIFRNAVEPYLRDVKGRRGLTDYKVVCDGNNNTEQVIDSNGFVGDLYLKPTRSINFIQLNFIATRTGIEFNEIIGQTIA